MSVFSIPSTDLKNIIKLFSRKIGLLFICFLFLYLDSEVFAANFKDGQIIVNILTIFAFVFLYSRSVKRTRKLMVYGLFIGVLIEYFFSVYLDMYSYRLVNIPLYVPFGHALVYVRVYVFSKSSLIKKHQKVIEQFLYAIISIFALTYLYFFNDVFGFVMTLGVFLLIIKIPKDKICFLTMYVVVAVLEFEGTTFRIWAWPDTAFRVFDFLPSHNPPSGISFFYFIIPIGCFLMYTKLNTKTWKRFKKMNKISNNIVSK